MMQLVGKIDTGDVADAERLERSRCVSVSDELPTRLHPLHETDY
jgi:hypothetical protein